MEITIYSSNYKQQVIDLILDIQNKEAKVGISLNEQSDLLDINRYYMRNGGCFWIAIADNQIIGTIGLMKSEQDWGILKKFFVHSDYRSQKIGLALYQKLIGFVKENDIHHVILDTPAVAEKSHLFYERAGFKRIEKRNLPFSYSYPDRDSLLYQLDL
jgi:N-acetylglutamate synthase-like GNAT family acetyltransferase